MGTLESIALLLLLLFQTRALMCDVYAQNDLAMQRQSLRLIELITCVLSSPLTLLRQS